MPDEKNSTAKNGKSVGLVERVKTGIQEDFQSLKTDLPAKAKEQVEGSEGAHQDPGLYLDLPPQARRHSPQSRSGRALQRFPASASREDQSRRGALQLHLGNGRHHVLSVYCADLHRACC